MMAAEQQVLSLMGLKGQDYSIEPVADLLISLGYPDVARELRSRWDLIASRSDMEDYI